MQSSLTTRRGSMLLAERTHLLFASRILRLAPCICGERPQPSILVGLAASPPCLALFIGKRQRRQDGASKRLLMSQRRRCCCRARLFRGGASKIFAFDRLRCRGWSARASPHARLVRQKTSDSLVSILLWCPTLVAVVGNGSSRIHRGASLPLCNSSTRSSCHYVGTQQRRVDATLARKPSRQADGDQLASVDHDGLGLVHTA